ncbi:MULTISPECIES: hypothetical protein [unclassified Pseudomonas]|jgi:hypothetical protein|uniref:hypothetical protein n=1 Tax=unclassified Pseudomonas TaxID=196821 RepID=UPI0035C19265
MSVRLLLLGSIGGIALAGCAGQPMEHREPYQVIVVDMPVRQAYEGMKAHPYCGTGWLVDGQYDAYDDSFVVRYSFPGFFGASLPSDIVLGTKTEDGATELRLVSQEKWKTPISKKFLNRLQSGACE